MTIHPPIVCRASGRSISVRSSVRPSSVWLFVSIPPLIVALSGLFKCLLSGGGAAAREFSLPLQNRRGSTTTRARHTHCCRLPEFCHFHFLTKTGSYPDDANIESDL